MSFFPFTGGTYVQMDRIFMIVLEKILNSNITSIRWKQYVNDTTTFVKIIAIYGIFLLLNQYLMYKKDIQAKVSFLSIDHNTEK